jgi:hypothetical protein
MRPPISTTSLSKPKRPSGNREVGVARQMPAQRRSRDLSSSMIAQCAEVPCSYFGAASSAHGGIRAERFGVLILGSGQGGRLVWRSWESFAQTITPSAGEVASMSVNRQIRPRCD